MEVMPILPRSLEVVSVSSGLVIAVLFVHVNVCRF